MALGQPIQHLADGHLVVTEVSLADAQRPAARDPVGGDGDVHQNIGDGVLVDEIAQVPEGLDQVALEPRVGLGAHRALAEDAHQRREVQRLHLGLVVHQTAEQPPVGHLGALQPDPGPVPLQGEAAADEEAADAGEVALDRGGADVDLVRGVVDVQRLLRLQQPLEELVEPILGCPGLGGPLAQRGVRGRPRTVATSARLDDDGVRNPGVQRRHVGTDRTGSHPEEVGQRRGGDPALHSHQVGEQPVLSSP